MPDRSSPFEPALSNELPVPIRLLSLPSERRLPLALLLAAAGLAAAAWALLPAWTDLMYAVMAGALPRRWPGRRARPRPPAGRLPGRVSELPEAGSGRTSMAQQPAAEVSWAEHLPVSLVMLDPHTLRVLGVNRWAAREFRLRRSRLLGRPVTEGFHALPDLPALARRLQEAPVGASADIQWHHRGRLRTVQLRLGQVPAGAQAMVVLVARDVSAERETAQHLQEAHEHLALIGDTMDDCLFVTDPGRSQLIYFNRKAEAIWGLSTEQLQRDPLQPLTLVLPEDQPLLREREHRERARRPSDITYRIQHPKLGLRTLRSRTRTADAPDGQLRVYGLLSDVTDQHQREVALQLALDTAEAASQAKSQFMANMSHEIRTPMNGILGMTELLLGTAMTDRQRRFAQAVYRSGEALLEIINDILDFSKIEAGKLELAPVDFLLRGVVEDTLEMLAPRAHDKGLELSFREAASLPELVCGDPLRLRQVLTNLVANAIKFTHHGEVVIDLMATVTPPGAPEGSLALQFSVRDTGIGIEADVLPRLFNAFTQANGGMSKRYGGTGLGLAISRQLIELMGGQIQVRSAPGVGSEFTFTVLLGEVQPAPRALVGPQSEFASLQGPLDLPVLRVLVVDDHPTNRSLLENLLGDWGMEVTVAHDGQEALEILHPARAGQATPQFDLALIDMHMPRLDGLGLAHAVRSAGLHPDLRMILLSSVSSPDDVLASQRAGFHRFVAKPIRRAELRQAMVGAMSSASPHEPAAVAGPPLRGKVLVIEDNAVNQEVIAQMLRHFGLQVTLSSSALHGLRKLGEAHFDLVLMDIQMPGMDGVEALTWFRRGSGSRFSFLTPPETPVIAVTANALGGDEQRFISLGFDDYLSKPFRQSQLHAMLTQHLRPHAPVEETGATAGGAAAPAPGASGAPSGVLDEEALDRLRQLDPQGKNQLLARVSQAFHTSAARLVPLLREAELAQDLNGVRHVAHTLKSSSASIGALQLSQQCAELEAQIRLERVENLSVQVDRIVSEIEVVLQALKLLMDAPG